MKYFRLSEFCQSATAKSHGIDMTPPPAVSANIESLVNNVLDPLRAHLGKAIIVSSGYRPPALNKLVGGAATSQHATGCAADISVAGIPPKQLCEIIIGLKLPFDQLIMEFGRWTHVSFGPRNRRQVLTAKTVNGKTVYDPGL